MYIYIYTYSVHIIVIMIMILTGVAATEAFDRASLALGAPQEAIQLNSSNKNTNNG